MKYCTEFVDMFGHSETDSDQQHAGDDHQCRHYNHCTLHPGTVQTQSHLISLANRSTHVQKRRT